MDTYCTWNTYVCVLEKHLAIAPEDISARRSKTQDPRDVRSLRR